jgi:hypothetical protein
VWDKNTRRGGGSLGITHSIPALTQRENTKFAGGCVARFEPIPSAFVHTTVEWTGCLRALASSLMVLILIIGLVAFIAIRTSQNASQQRDIAVSRQLITESEHLSAIDPVTAKLKSLAAWRIHPSDDAWQAMLAAALVPGIAVMRGHSDAVDSVAFSPDGKTLASGSIDDSVRLWDVASHWRVGDRLTTSDTGTVFSVRPEGPDLAFSPDGKTLASGSIDDSVRLWDVDSHRLIDSPLTGHTDTVISVAFSPDGKTLASGSIDDSVRLWDVASHRLVSAPLTAHQDAFRSVVAFSPDGKTLATGSSADNSVELWNIPQLCRQMRLGRQDQPPRFAQRDRA